MADGACRAACSRRSPMRVLAIHGVGHADAKTDWQAGWRRAVEDGLARWESRGEPELHFLAYDHFFAQHELHAGVVVEAFGRLVASGLFHGLADVFRNRRGIGDTLEGVRWTAGMVAQWTALEALRAQLRRHLGDAMREVEPDVVLAHSLGSLIAYDTLKQDEMANGAAALIRGRTLVTLGSQIGNPAVRAIFGGRVEALARARFWWHLFNEEDDVFTAPIELPAVERFRQVETRFELDGWGDHDGVCYLAHEETSRTVWQDLAAPRGRGLAAQRRAPVAPAAPREPQQRALLVGIADYREPGGSARRARQRRVQHERNAAGARLPGGQHPRRVERARHHRRHSRAPALAARRRQAGRQPLLPLRRPRRPGSGLRAGRRGGSHRRVPRPVRLRLEPATRDHRRRVLRAVQPASVRCRVRGGARLLPFRWADARRQPEVARDHAARRHPAPHAALEPKARDVGAARSLRHESRRRARQEGGAEAEGRPRGVGGAERRRAQAGARHQPVVEDRRRSSAQRRRPTAIAARMRRSCTRPAPRASRPTSIATASRPTAPSPTRCARRCAMATSGAGRRRTLPTFGRLLEEARTRVRIVVSEPQTPQLVCPAVRLGQRFPGTIASAKSGARRRR